MARRTFIDAKLVYRRSLIVSVCSLLVSLFAGSAMAQNARWGIFVMRPDGGDVRMLAQIEDGKEHVGPRWSHDGKQILFAAQSISTRQTSVYLIDADGGDLRNLAIARHPAWSPDDKQIAMETFSVNRSVTVQNLDGKGRVELATGASPSWSPDGSRIAFSNQDNLYVIDLVNGETRALFKHPRETIYYGFTWFPDGKRLVVVARPEPRKSRQLLYVSAEGEEHGLHVRLTGEMAGCASFSPDAKKLAVDSSYKVQILDVDGTGGMKVVPGQIGANRDPDWSPDGQWIVFTSSRDPR